MRDQTPYKQNLLRLILLSAALLLLGACQFTTATATLSKSQSASQSSESRPSPSVSPSVVSNGMDWVGFAGSCDPSLAVKVSGADTASIACSAGSWTYTSPTQSTDGTRVYTFTQTAASGASSSVSATWVRTTSGPATQTVTLDLNALMATYLSTYNSAIQSEVQSASVQLYYSTSYYLNGLLWAVEGTDNEEWLVKHLGYINAMLNVATDLNGDGLKEWGKLDANNRPEQLSTFQITVPLAKTAAYIRNSSLFKTKYAQDANRIYEFVDSNIMRYWFDKTAGVYKVSNPATWTWAAGYMPWLSVGQGGWEATDGAKIVSDKALLAGNAAIAMYRAGNSPFYLDIATRLASWVKARLEPSGQGSIWSAHFPLSFWQSSSYSANSVPFYDTSHGNRMPAFVVGAHEAGLVLDLSDVKRLARTLTDTIWLRASPTMQFSNYISGDNTDWATTPAIGPSGIGNVYFGWSLLASYDARANEVMRMTLQGMINGQNIGQNNTSYGKISMTGALLRAAKFLEK